MLFFNCLTKSCKKFFKKVDCRPFKRSDSYVYFERGLNQYLEEIDIVNIIKELRNFNAALEIMKTSNPKFEQKFLKFQGRQSTIDLDEIRNLRDFELGKS